MQVPSYQPLDYRALEFRRLECITRVLLVVQCLSISTLSLGGAISGFLKRNTHEVVSGLFSGDGGAMTATKTFEVIVVPYDGPPEHYHGETGGNYGPSR